MSESIKYHYFLIAYSYKLVDGSNGNGTFIKGFVDQGCFDSNITSKDLEILAEEAKDKIAKSIRDKQFVFQNCFISSISRLGLMTEEEFNGKS